MEREMHKAVCAECGKECEVPFVVDNSRPVYCHDCWKKRPPKRGLRHVADYSFSHHSDTAWARSR